MTAQATTPEGQQGARVAVVEDDASIRLGLEINLRSAGYEVLSASDGPSGLQLIRRATPDLLVLDLLLPGLSGLEVLRRLRAEGRSLPVLILSALGQEADKVAGLRLGADDYLAKPFGVRELLARIEALLRRTRPAGGASGAQVSFGDVQVDLTARTVARGQEPVHLTPTEFDLLEVLVRAPGRAQSRSHLLGRVWGRGYEGTERTVDNFVNSLRRKLEQDPSRPQHLVTVRGRGYRFDP